MNLPLLVGLSLGAGALTTFAGLGGGMLLLLALSLVTDPASALAATAPALLAGNLHRALMFRPSLELDTARRFATGALPGALVGGIAVAGLPHSVVHVALVVTTLASVARALGVFAWRPPRSVIAPAGLGIGALTAVTGGAAMLTAPLLLGTGLAGEAYVATVSACAAAMHAGRIVGYAAAGFFSREIVVAAGVLTAAILAGNLFGRRLRPLADRLPDGVVEHVVLVGCVTLAVLGVAG